MNNVYISHQAVEDLNAIFYALITWKRGRLTINHALKYVDDLEAECYSIADIKKHFSTKYKTHRQFGANVHKYRRNPNTVWYIIYDINSYGSIFINKIISNHTTRQ